MLFKVGDSANITKKMTTDDVLQFAKLSGDTNSVHINPEAAAKSRFGKQVCHGMLVASLISAVLGTKLPGEGTIYLGQELKFVAPVYFGDTLSAEAQIIEINGKRLKLKTTVTNQEGKEVVVGVADVLYDGIAN